MLRSKPMHDGTRRPLVLALALTLPLLALAGGRAAASDDDIIWMRVQVNDQGGEHTKVRVNLPLSLIEVVVDSIDRREFMAELEGKHPSLDIPKLWRQIRGMEGDEFVTVESDQEHIRVWKDKDFFRINVRAEKSEEASVEVQIPLVVMDYLFDNLKEKTFSFQEMVEKLRGHLPLTLVQARHGEEHVKIWLEEE